MTDCIGLENMLDHIMFHKALIDEEKDYRKLDHYIEMARDFDQGAEAVPRDPMDRSLQLVFDLVLANNYDPWDIDLISFTDMYMKKMQTSEVNFIVAGKLVFMAWSILKLQSQQLLVSHEDRSTLFCSDWDFDNLEEFYEARPQNCLDMDVPEAVDLCEAMRHHSQRPVSLIELLDAFEEANEEARRQEERARLREMLKDSDQKFDSKSHGEDLEKDVEMVWKRILKCGTGPVVIDDLFEGSKEDRITVFVALLFLARNGKIALWQNDLPHGQIFLEMKIPWDIGTMEDAKHAVPEPQQIAVM